MLSAKCGVLPVPDIYEIPVPISYLNGREDRLPSQSSPRLWPYTTTNSGRINGRRPTPVEAESALSYDDFE